MHPAACKLMPESCGFSRGKPKNENAMQLCQDFTTENTTAIQLSLTMTENATHT
jgi:hypothetical protein